jgi:2-C-methyl-D-erythritol 4-phosphate cytidylyltransferase
VNTGQKQLTEMTREELIERTYALQECLSAIEEIIQLPNAEGDPTAQAVQQCIKDYILY